MGDEKNKLFVGNLDYETTEGDLAELFERNGPVDDVVIVLERDTGKSRGFGFVTFKSSDDALKAKDELHEYDLQGRKLTVREAKPKRGGGGGGGYRSGGYGGGGGGYGGGGGGYGGGGYGGGSYGGGGYGGGRGGGGGYRGGDGYEGGGGGGGNRHGGNRYDDGGGYRGGDGYGRSGRSNYSQDDY